LRYNIIVDELGETDLIHEEELVELASVREDLEFLRLAEDPEGVGRRLLKVEIEAALDVLVAVGGGELLFERLAEDIVDYVEKGRELLGGEVVLETEADVLLIQVQKDVEALLVPSDVLLDVQPRR
jgi:hypothetical protein